MGLRRFRRRFFRLYLFSCCEPVKRRPLPLPIYLSPKRFPHLEGKKPGTVWSLFTIQYQELDHFSRPTFIAYGPNAVLLFNFSPAGNYGNYAIVHMQCTPYDFLQCQQFKRFFFTTHHPMWHTILFILKTRKHHCITRPTIFIFTYLPVFEQNIELFSLLASYAFVHSALKNSTKIRYHS